MKMNNPFEEEGKSFKIPEPCVLVIFGATGDLATKRILPSLYSLLQEGCLPSNFIIVAYARKEKTSESYRSEMKENIKTRLKNSFSEDDWFNFSNKLFYHKANLDEDEGYKTLNEFLKGIDSKYKTNKNRVYYLSTPPKYFPIVIEKLYNNGCIYPYDDKTKWSRVIIEKPFGKDEKTAKELQHHILKYLNEEQIYRIDHYLGKETVQNLLVFRFANTIFESVWNKEHIDHVQITVAEEKGIDSRGRFFEEQGILRDIIQNHMMQLLALTAMEMPESISAHNIRKEKVNVLKSIAPFEISDLCDNIVRGQYKEGYIYGEKVLAYKEEQDVDKNSNTDTYAALKIFINNKRWKGVPFYLRAGKRLPKRTTEIAIIFKSPEKGFFKTKLENNVLAIRIQPNEGIAMKINCKEPYQSIAMQPVQMDFRYGSYFGKKPPDAYERLLCDCMLGDNTLFTSEDEVISSWQLLTPILDYWGKNHSKIIESYESGTWGPKCSDEMMKKDKKSWRLL